MERKIKATVDIDEIVFDKEIYPRNEPFWMYYYEYAQAMKTGSKFPPIVLAKHNNKLYLIDGKHRIEANKLLKNKKIEAEVYIGWSRERMFEESIKLNISHGKPLSPFDKRKIALKLKDLKYPDIKISQIIKVPLANLQKFTSQKLVSSTTGKTLIEVPLKSSLKHLAGQHMDIEDIGNINNSQQIMKSQQIRLLNELIRIIEDDLLDINNKSISEAIKTLKDLLENKY